MPIAKAYTPAGWKSSDIESPRVWNGSAWIFPTVRIWDGSGWVRNVGLPYSSFMVEDIQTYTSASAIIYLNTDGTVTYDGSPTYNITKWIQTTSTSPAGYQVYVTVNSGTLDVTSGTGTWLDINTTRAWGVSFNFGTKSATITLQIRRSGTTDILSTSQILLYANSAYPDPIP